MGAHASGANKVSTGQVRNHSSMMPASKPRQPARMAEVPNHSNMDEDALTAAAIAAALDEDESAALAAQLQNEAYSGGLSARGGAGAGGNDNGAGLADAFQSEQMMDDGGAGVRAAQPQVMDQLIGGVEEPMQVDEYSSHAVRAPRDNFGAGARDNFPSGF